MIGHDVDRVVSHVKNHNVLMSLPTCLIHCILSDWVDVVSVIRLDFAFSCGCGVFHLRLLDILKSAPFYAKRVERPKNFPTWGVLPPQHPYTHILDWIVRRQLKVVHIEPHELCSPAVLETFLQKYGEHVRHICPHEDCNRKYEYRHLPTQGALIAKYCHNLTAYVVNCHESHDRSILSVLNNNPRLEKLHIDGSLSGENDPARHPIEILHHLKQLKWCVKYGFDDSLVALVRAAPNLQQLSIYCNPWKCPNVVKVARACPHLRTLSCSELHFGLNDSFLRPFLAACSGIVNLDISMHYDLTDTVLIEALSELNSLYFLNLRGCRRLTDRTLQFLAKRFASTLKVLYLDYSRVYQKYYGEEVTVGYTAAGIASLRAQCTHLHTFHYSMQVDASASPLYAYESATIVHMFAGYERFLPLMLEHCQQMQILAMTSAHYSGSRVWLTVDQLMAIAARCPQLHTVIIGKKFWEDEKVVDYRGVTKAFPSLLFTEDRRALNFDVLEVPF